MQRRDWHLLRVLQIFVEHTMEYVFEVTKKIAMRMYKVNIIIITGKFNPAYVLIVYSTCLTLKH